MSAQKKQRFIIVGLGNRGRDAFTRALLGFPSRGFPEFKERAEIVAFVDSNIERARVANEVLGTNIPVFTSISDAASAHPADWAVITTSDFTHADVATAALSHGLNVVIDKPLASSVWECNRIIEASQKYGRQVIAGHNMRYNEHMLALAKLVRGGAIGKVQQIEAAEYSVVFDAKAKQKSSSGGAEMGYFPNEGRPEIRLFHKNGSVEFIDIKTLHKGFGHGGADVKLIASVLGVELPGVDPLQRTTPEQARNAVAIADMAARTIAKGGSYVAFEETGLDFPPPPS